MDVHRLCFSMHPACDDMEQVVRWAETGDMRHSHPPIQSRSTNEADSAEERGNIDVLFALGHDLQESVVRRPGMREGGGVRRMSTPSNDEADFALSI